MTNKLRIATFEEAGAFLDHAQEALEQNEEENHLILGICLRIRASQNSGQAQPYLAAVEDQGEIVLAAMMTPPYPLILGQFGRPYQEALDVVANELHQSEWSVPEVNGPDPVSERFADRWSKQIGGVKRISRRQRLYTLRKPQIPADVQGSLRAASSSDLPVILAWGEAFIVELSLEMDITQFQQVLTNQVVNNNLVLWEDGEPVSMAMKNRPSHNGIAVSYVYTPPEKRRHGYASACVASLSQQMLAGGYRFCALYTDSYNPTSNRIYQQIGYKPVTEFTSYTFA